MYKNSKYFSVCSVRFDYFFLEINPDFDFVYFAYDQVWLGALASIWLSWRILDYAVVKGQVPNKKTQSWVDAMELFEMACHHGAKVSKAHFPREFFSIKTIFAALLFRLYYFWNYPTECLIVNLVFSLSVCKRIVLTPSS